MPISPQRLERLSLALAAGAGLAGLAVLTGWLLRAPWLRAPLGPPGMRANTALCTVLFAAGVLALHWKKGRTISLLAGGALLAVSLATLTEHLFALELGIDQLVAADPELAGSGAPRGRMPATSALAFLAFGLGLWAPRLFPAKVIDQLLVGAGALLAWTAAVDALAEPTAEQGGPSFRRMPFEASLLLLSLTAASLLSAPERGLMRLLRAPGAGGRLARRLVPATFLMPPVLLWLRAETERAGLIPRAVGQLLMVMVIALALSTLVLWTSHQLERAEGAAAALAAVRDAHARAAEEANRFVDTIVESLPHMVFVKDARTLRFVRINKAGEALLGVRREQLLGKGDRDFFPPEQAAFFEAKDREALAGGKLVDIPEEPLDTPAGTRWLHTQKVPLVDERGAPAYLLGISFDVTEAREAQRALAESKVATEAANAELEAFAYSVSHDLRGPLRSIAGFAEALEEDAGPVLDDEARAHLLRIRRAAQRMGQLIDDLLRLARFTRAPLQPERVDLSSLAGEVVEGLLEEHRGREIQVRIAPGIIASGDRRLLRVALENLLGNAFKFTRGRAPARIEVAGAVADGKLRLSVKDNGAGFDMAYVGKLFTPFERLHPSHQFEGTGIGLATVQRIVRRHGGEVFAEARPEEGATFTMELPLPEASV